MEELCRSCLTNHPDNYSLDTILLDNEIFSETEPPGTIFYLLERVTGLKVRFVQQFPTQICAPCLDHLKIAYKFVLQFERSHKILAATHYEAIQCKLELVASSNELTNSNQALEDVQLKDETAEELNICDLQSLLHTEKMLDDEDAKISVCEETEVYLIPESPEPMIPVKRRKKYFCDICDYFSQSRSGYEYHKLTHEETQHVYNVCQKAFPARTTSQMDESHGSCVCDICGKCFNHASILLNHIEAHNGTKTFLCNYCTNVYKRRIDLKKHIKSMHYSKIIVAGKS